MHQTRPAHLIPENFAGDEPDQVQDLSHRNNGPVFSKANPWHDWRPRAKNLSSSGPPRDRKAPVGTEKEPVIPSERLVQVGGLANEL